MTLIIGFICYQGNKGQLVANSLGLGGAGLKNATLQSPPNVSVSKSGVGDSLVVSLGQVVNSNAGPGGMPSMSVGLNNSGEFVLQVKRV